MAKNTGKNAAQTVTLETLRPMAVEACKGHAAGTATVWAVLQQDGNLAGSADAFDGWLEGVRDDLKAAKLEDGTLRNYASRVRKLLKAGTKVPVSSSEGRDEAAKLDKEGNVKPEASEADKLAEKAAKAKAKEQDARLASIPLEGRLLLEKLNIAAVAVMLVDPSLGVAALERAYGEIEVAGKALVAAPTGNAAAPAAPAKRAA